MKAKIDFVGQQSIFTNEDELNVEVVIKRGHDEPYFSNLISSVELRLVCEGFFGLANGNECAVRSVTYYKSDPIFGRCNYTTRGHVIYSAALQFPPSDAGLPSSLTYDGRKRNSVRWLVKAVIHRGDAGAKQAVERSCMFRTTCPLPSLLNLVDVEHTDVIDGAKMTLITTHAAAGLPQVPLAAGLSFSIDCDSPGKFRLTRLRLLLHELNTVTLGSKSLDLPLRRWLLEDYRPRHGGISLGHRITNLDHWVGDIHVDHATLAPSFETDALHHGFDLVVEVTLGWDDNEGQPVTRRISSISPVKVLSRINGAQYAAIAAAAPGMTSIYSRGGETPPHVIFDPAEITDTTDDESSLTNLDEDATKVEEGVISTMSSDSVASVFSDHHKVVIEDSSRPLPSIVYNEQLYDI